jgi:orotate phosphoribosyltransferase
VAAEDIRAADVLGLLERTGAMLSGHFRLSSGRHSDRYVEKARILERPEAVARLAPAIASRYERVETVVSPAVGAIPLGFAVAQASGARFVFTEREAGRMALRRGFVLHRGERVLVVEDVITTGGSAREVFDLVEGLGAEALGVAALVDRSAAPPGFPLRSLVRVEARSWDPAECPLCRDGLALTSPGSRHIETMGRTVTVT